MGSPAGGGQEGSDLEDWNSDEESDEDFPASDGEAAPASTGATWHAALHLHSAPCICQLCRTRCRVLHDRGFTSSGTVQRHCSTRQINAYLVMVTV
jgi:hypothetical protein